MKWIKKIIKAYLFKKGFRKFTSGELKMIIISTEIVENYISSRKFRRTMNDLDLGKSIRNLLNEWND
tara:strand:+ start:7150 stop:7350 length:201 start_codon:yes stop_codon:yes gene_type:complete